MSPIAGGSGGWHPAQMGYGPGHGPGPGPAQGAVHGYALGPPPPGPMPPQMQMQMHMQMHMHGKDHPPLSRSAYEPGSRSMNTWTEMRRGDMPPPGHRDYERGPPLEGYGMSGSPRRFTQMRERRLSESSAEEEEEDELLHEDEQSASQQPRIKAEREDARLQRADVDSLPRGSTSAGGSSEDEADKTVTMRSGPRPRSTTSASSTSNLRAGLNSLLNPEDRAKDERG